MWNINSPQGHIPCTIFTYPTIFPSKFGVCTIQVCVLYSNFYGNYNYLLMPINWPRTTSNHMKLRCQHVHMHVPLNAGRVHCVQLFIQNLCCLRKLNKQLTKTSQFVKHKQFSHVMCHGDGQNVVKSHSCMERRFLKIYHLFPSVLRHRWLDDRKNVWPVKKLAPLIPRCSLPKQVKEES